MGPENISINSNFLDYYDYLFGHAEPVVEWVRNIEPLSCESKFLLLQKMGAKTPRFGTVRDLQKQFELEAMQKRLPGLESFNTLIVYDDLSGVNGEGKVLMNIDEALKNGLENEFASEYVVADGFGAARAYRYIQCGTIWSWIEYECPDDWRANAGNRRSRILRGQVPPTLDISMLKTPVFAIDYVFPYSGPRIAVDLILNPILVKEEAFIFAWDEKQIAASIANWFEKNPKSSSVLP